MSGYRTVCPATGQSENRTMPQLARATFPPLITASTWSAALGAAEARALNRRGTTLGGSPRLTNAEAVQLVKAWRDAATPARWPLWYQFAAVAYGWDPPESDSLDAVNADGAYPDVLADALWPELHRLAGELDADRTSARLAFDPSPYTDIDMLASMRRALREDGAQAEFKIPLPACKDPKTGKPTGRPHRDPKTGKWSCKPVAVDDPITAVANSFGTLALIVGLVWFLASDNPRRRRRN